MTFGAVFGREPEEEEASGGGGSCCTFLPYFAPIDRTRFIRLSLNVIRLCLGSDTFKGSVVLVSKLKDKGVEGGGVFFFFSTKRSRDFTNDDDDEEGRDFEIKDVASRIDEELGRDLCC